MESIRGNAEELVSIDWLHVVDTHAVSKRQCIRNFIHSQCVMLFIFLAFQRFLFEFFFQFMTENNLFILVNQFLFVQYLIIIKYSLNNFYTANKLSQFQHTLRLISILMTNAYSECRIYFPLLYDYSYVSITQTVYSLNRRNVIKYEKALLIIWKWEEKLKCMNENVSRVLGLY